MARRNRKKERPTKRRKRLALAAGGAGLAIALVWWLGRAPRVAQGQSLVVYRSPASQCCDKWAAHMKRADFTVDIRIVRNVGAIKASYGIHQAIASCHTAVVEGYAIEGHVPADAVGRLLEERPAVMGLAVPGMPLGAPGMEGQVQEPVDVLAFDATGRTQRYAKY